MRSLLSSSLCCAAALALGATAGCSRPTPPQPVANVVELGGPVQAVRPGAPESAAALGAVLSGDALSTGASGWTLLRLGDGREVELGEQSRVTATAASGAPSLELASGALLVRANPAAAAATVAVATPFGTASVPGAAEVEIVVAPERAQVEVRAGEVSFAGRGGASQTASAGARLEANASEVKAAGGAAAAAAPAKSAAPAKPQPLQLKAVAKRGTLAVRRANSLRFALVGPEGVAIGSGAIVRAGRDAQGTFEGDGLRVVALPGSSTSVANAERGPSGPVYRLALEDGAIRLAFAGGPAAVALAGSGGDTSLTAPERATVTASRADGGLLLEIHAGKLQAGPQALKAGERAVLAGGSLRTEQPAPPAVVAPFAKPAQIFANELDRVGLEVPGGGEAGVAIEVANDAGFADVLLAGRVFAPQVAVAAPPSGELHWRVLDAQGAPGDSARVKFEADTSRPAGAAGVSHAELKDTGGKTTVTFDGTPPSLGFNFAANDAALLYKLKVFKAGDTSSPVVDKLCPTTKCNLERGELKPGNYTWQALAMDAGGAEIPGSKSNKLELVPGGGGATDTLAIARPRSDEAAGAEIVVQGSAPVGCTLSVNGTPATLDAKGAFDLKVPKAPQVVFKMVASDGAESYWVRRLK